MGVVPLTMNRLFFSAKYSLVCAAYNSADATQLGRGFFEALGRFAPLCFKILIMKALQKHYWCPTVFRARISFCQRRIANPPLA